MSGIEVEHLCAWIGKSRCDEDLIALRHARLMAATIDYPDVERLQEGEPLPPLWHWIYFLEGEPTGELGHDGHPARGGFMPPVPLANRMWAGGRVTFLAPVPIGSTVRKVSRILKLDHKVGKSGDLVFVTVLHEITSRQDELLIREEQDIVYKNPAPAGVPVMSTDIAPPSRFMMSYTPTATMLFRYSALTFNGHRIHYDADYCREAEGYRNLVIHGPLNATMLAGFAEQISGSRLSGFSYRGLAPALLGDRITIHASVSDGRVSLAALLDRNIACMKAEAVIRQ